MQCTKGQRHRVKPHYEDGKMISSCNNFKTVSSLILFNSITRLNTKNKETLIVLDSTSGGGKVFKSGDD